MVSDYGRFCSTLIVLTVLGLAFVTETAVAQSYTGTDLYILATPRGFPDPTGLGFFSPSSAANRQVTGFSVLMANSAGGDALLWTNPSGAVTYLTPAGFDRAFTTATNGFQQVGAAEIDSMLTHAMLWSGTAASAIDLHPTNLTGFASSVAEGIGGGQQVGNGISATGTDHAPLWSGTGNSAVDLHPTGFIAFDSSAANGTDGSHQVGAMWNSTLAFNPHAVLWNGTAASAIDLHPTNLSGFDQSTAYGVSGTQQVGDGFGTGTGGFLHALLWNGTANSAVDLHPTQLMIGFNSSHANSTNGVFQVGNISNTMTQAQNAVLWAGTAASAIDLGLLLPFSSSFSDAFTIDAQGNVFGAAVDPTGAIHAVEWSPVPEPAALALFAAGITVLFAFRQGFNYH
jgi:hypothetical protein